MKHMLKLIFSPWLLLAGGWVTWEWMTLSEPVNDLRLTAMIICGPVLLGIGLWMAWQVITFDSGRAVRS